MPGRAPGSTSLADVGYRVLSVLVQARYQLALLIALLNAIFLLLEVRLLLDEPSWLGAVGLLDTPLLLVVAVAPWRSCRRGSLSWWRRRWGARAARCRPPAAPRAAFRWAIAGSGGCWSRAAWGSSSGAASRCSPRATRCGRGGASRHPWAWACSWPRVPFAAASRSGRRTRCTYSGCCGRSARRMRRGDAGRLAISPRQIQEVPTGWQYAALRRYPALRIRYLGDEPAAQVTYLAFDTPAERDAVRARLG